MQRSCDRCKGKGRGGVGVANGHMTVGGGGGGAGPPLWARRALHFGLVRPATLGLSGLPPLGPFGPPPGSVRSVQYKARRLVAGLKKN